MDAYISQFTSLQIDQSIGISLNVIKLITLLTSYGYDVITVADDPEWSFLVTDSEDKVLAGVRIDGSVFMADL